MTSEDILSLVPEETKDIVENDFKIKKLLSLEPLEILKEIENPESDIYELISNSPFEEYYSILVVQGMFKGLTNEYVASNLFGEIRNGLGKYILDNNLNLNTLAIESIDFVGSIGTTINLYEATGKEMKYIVTLSSSSTKGEMEPYKVCTAQDKEKLLEEHKGISASGVILVAESGAIIEYTGGDEYIFVDEDNDVYENYGGTTYHNSYAEVLYNRIRGSAKRFEELQEYSIEHLLNKELALMNVLKDDYLKITGSKRKFVPKDIENATTDITLEDVQKILDEMTGPQITKEESLKKGIGFDEH